MVTRSSTFASETRSIELLTSRSTQAGEFLWYCSQYGTFDGTLPCTHCRTTTTIPPSSPHIPYQCSNELQIGVIRLYIATTLHIVASHLPLLHKVCISRRRINPSSADAPNILGTRFAPASRRHKMTICPFHWPLLTGRTLQTGSV
jgi:hypothetical protein